MAKEIGDFDGIGAPAKRALLGAGHRRLEDLASVSEKQLLALHGMGPKATGILRARMAAKGLQFLA